MISAFGAQAEHYAAGMGAVDAILVEPQYVGAGYIEAVRRRKDGEPFYGMLLLEDPRDRTMTQLAPMVLSQGTDADQQRALLSGAVNGGVWMHGKLASELLAEPGLTDPNLVSAAREFFALCPAVLVRSVVEYARLSALMARPRPYETIVVEPRVPLVERRPAARPGFVIWAPDRDANAAAFTAFGLTELRGDVTLVSADGITPHGTSVSACVPGDPRVAMALATASVIVLADASDPGSAIAFARAGYGIVAPISSGVREFVRDVCTYDPALPRQLHVAAIMALAQPASLRDLPSRPPRAPMPPALPAAVAAAPPPATIVVPTFNRPDDLDLCLQCLAAQTYPNVRAVIVNDCGRSVTDVVARYPFARLLDLEHNSGTVRAFIAGVGLVNEGFVQVLSDDDWLYPDHLERLVTVMERSGAAAAHANTLIRYVRRTERGAFDTTGFNATTFGETATPTETLLYAPIAGHALLLRLSVFADIGGWREDCYLADQEIQMRVGERYSVAYVDQITAEWRIHDDNFSCKVNAADEQRRIYEELHPVPSRPILTAMRQTVLDSIAARPPGYMFPPTVRLQ
jgi:Glycosyl transferase family 2